jgi:PAS domain S-box-containing protein
VDIENGFVRTEEFVTPGTILKKVVSTLGFNPVGKTYKTDDSLLELNSGNIRKFQHGLYELSFKSIPRHVASAVEKLLDLGDIFGIAFLVDNRIFANSAMLFPKGKELDHKGLIETFARQAAVTLKRIAAEKNEEKYRSLFEIMSHGAFYLDTDRHCIDVNNAALKILGVSREEFLNYGILNPLWKIVDEQGDPLSAEESAFRIALTAGQPVYDKIFGIFNPLRGDYVWVITNAIPQFLSGEKAPYRVFVTMHDITEQKQKTEALRISEQHAKAVIDAIPDMIFRMDSEGVFISYKAANEDLFVSPEMFIGKNISEVLPAEIAVLTKEKIQQAFNTFNIQIFNYDLQIQHKASQYFECRMIPCSPNEVVAIVRNITEQRQSERELIKSEARLRETNATKDKFFSIIAHDLKSPFNSILGFSELLRDEAKDMDIETIEKYAVIINSSSQHTLKLLDNLLVWATLQQGTIPFEPRMILLNELILSEVKGFRHASIQKNIGLTCDITENIILTADENMIGTVVRNLIANALKFTPQDGKVMVKAEIQNSLVSISVSDTGVGLTKENVDKLFRIETSFSTRGTENEKGTGLGLLLCKEFVEKHEGWIRVASVPGQGSMFIVTLPVK